MLPPSCLYMPYHHMPHSCMAMSLPPSQLHMSLPPITAVHALSLHASPLHGPHHPPCSHTVLLRASQLHMLRSESTPTFSSSYTYLAPDTWDTPPPSPTLVSKFPDIVPAHPLDILPRIAPEPFSLESLMRSWPYDSHRFTSFCPYRSDTNNRKLRLTARPHMTHTHILEHETFYLECVCPTHYPYGGNKRAK
jgi:hypothetical protein